MEGCDASEANRESERGRGGDRPVAANLRVVRGLLVLADSPPPCRRRAHAVVAEAAGLRPHPCTSNNLFNRLVARGHGPVNTVMPVARAHGTAAEELVLPAAAAGDNETTEGGEGAPEQPSCGDRT